MFEDSTFESMGRIHTRSRGWMIATFAFNGAILAALILIPLFHPEALSGKAIPWLMPAPPTPVEEPKPVVRPEPATRVQTQMPHGFIQFPSRIPHGYVVPAVPDPTYTTSWLDDSFGSNSGTPEGVFHGPSAGSVVVRGPVGPKPISSGVAIGLLIHRVVPDYPILPRTMHLEGTIVLQATISKGGTIENLRVVSGPAMLQQAAIDAVAQWRYRPYLLNGQPVEVETTVNVEFKMQ